MIHGIEKAAEKLEDSGIQKVEPHTTSKEEEVDEYPLINEELFLRDLAAGSVFGAGMGVGRYAFGGSPYEIPARALMGAVVSPVAGPVVRALDKHILLRLLSPVEQRTAAYYRNIRRF